MIPWWKKSKRRRERISTPTSSVWLDVQVFLSLAGMVLGTAFFFAMVHDLALIRIRDNQKNYGTTDRPFILHYSPEDEAADEDTRQRRWRDRNG